MFFLFNNIFYEVLEAGTTLIIDELNAKLHPLLMRYIINMFHDPMLNMNNAQLIFTAHDLFSLTKDTFRRDEIWFAEKDQMGLSKLFSLTE
jgi:AAA15 family ATPase/GTPase